MDYLQLVNGSFRVRMVVPVALRGVLGKSALIKGLGTANYTIANRLAEPYIAEFKSRIERVGKLSRVDTSKGRQYHNNIKPVRHPNSTDATSHSSEWYTPVRVFTAMKAEFYLDPASPGADVVDWIPAKRHLTIADDGLTTPWEGFVWLNPPYGLKYGMQKWLDKFAAHRNGVILLPGYTYSKWFHEFIVHTDCQLFPLFKFDFICPDRPDSKNCTLSNCLAAIGEKGITALATGCEQWIG